MVKPRFYLIHLFGDSVQVRIIDTLCSLIIQEKTAVSLNWINLSQIAVKAQIAKSSVKRIVDDLIASEFILEKEIKTHAKNPPRLIRLNEAQPVVRELLFYYRKIRGFL